LLCAWFSPGENLLKERELPDNYSLFCVENFSPIFPLLNTYKVDNKIYTDRIAYHAGQEGAFQGFQHPLLLLVLYLRK